MLVVVVVVLGRARATVGWITGALHTATCRVLGAWTRVVSGLWLGALMCDIDELA